MAEHEPSVRRHVGVVHSAGILRGAPNLASHGENRGSSPLGSAKILNINKHVTLDVSWEEGLT